MKTISILVKPASSACNLRCRYCFYADVAQHREQYSSGTMQEDVMQAMVQRCCEAVEEKGTVNISFQGGEPTVAGLEWFRKLFVCFAGHPSVTVNPSMQTNATLLDEEWAKFLHDHNFLIGVSLDGFESNMDEFRYDVVGKSVYYKVMNAIELLKKYHVEFNILTVITSQLSRKPEALMKFYAQHHFDYVQLIPCLPELGEESSSMSLTPDTYASFYIRFFDEWVKQMRKGTEVHVNLFENLAGMLQGIPPYQCGMIGRCVPQFVVEGNGNVYPCDFYCLDEYVLGNVRNTTFAQMQQSAAQKKFMEGSDCMKKTCRDCRFLNLCHGACRRQNICWLREDTCAYRDVLEYILPRLYRMLQR